MDKNYFENWGAVVRQHEHQTRMMITEQMFIPRCNNRFQNRTVEYLMPKLLNNLPLELKSLASPNDVKKHVKDYYLTTQWNNSVVFWVKSSVIR